MYCSLLTFYTHKDQHSSSMDRRKSHVAAGPSVSLGLWDRPLTISPRLKTLLKDQHFVSNWHEQQTADSQHDSLLIPKVLDAQVDLFEALCQDLEEKCNSGESLSQSKSGGRTASNGSDGFWPNESWTIEILNFKELNSKRGCIESTFCRQQKKRNCSVLAERRFHGLAVSILVGKKTF
jgi:hypothetical protein